MTHSEADPDLDSASIPSLIGQLLWQGVREEKQKWYDLLIFLPRFYITLRFDRRVKRLVEEGLARAAAARSLGETEAKAALQEFTSELMAVLVEKKLVRPG